MCIESLVHTDGEREAKWNADFAKRQAEREEFMVMIKQSTVPIDRDTALTENLNATMATFQNDMADSTAAILATFQKDMADSFQKSMVEMRAVLTSAKADREAFLKLNETVVKTSTSSTQELEAQPTAPPSARAMQYADCNSDTSNITTVDDVTPETGMACGNTAITLDGLNPPGTSVPTTVPPKNIAINSFLPAETTTKIRPPTSSPNVIHPPSSVPDNTDADALRPNQGHKKEKKRKRKKKKSKIFTQEIEAEPISPNADALRPNQGQNKEKKRKNKKKKSKICTQDIEAEPTSHPAHEAVEDATSESTSLIVSTSLSHCTPSDDLAEEAVLNSSFDLTVSKATLATDVSKGSYLVKLSLDGVPSKPLSLQCIFADSTLLVESAGT